MYGLERFCSIILLVGFPRVELVGGDDWRQTWESLICLTYASATPAATTWVFQPKLW
jgi:hypothetical protein